MPAHPLSLHPPSPSRPYSKEIDVELLAFIERYATNLARWDILVLFGQNPDLHESVRHIAKRLGRRPASIEKELEDLAYLGILCAHPNGRGMVYELDCEPGTRQAVTRLAHHLNEAAASRQRKYNSELDTRPLRH